MFDMGIYIAGVLTVILVQAAIIQMARDHWREYCPAHSIIEFIFFEGFFVSIILIIIGMAIDAPR